MRTIEKVNKIIEGSSKQLLPPKERSKKVGGIAADYEIEDNFEGQAKIIGAPR